MWCADPIRERFAGTKAVVKSDKTDLDEMWQNPGTSQTYYKNTIQGKEHYDEKCPLSVIK